MHHVVCEEMRKRIFVIDKQKKEIAVVLGFFLFV